MPRRKPIGSTKTNPAILLRKSIMTATQTAIRSTIKANRLMTEYKQLMRGTDEEGLDPSTLIIFDNGYYTIISGTGKIYHSFCKNKTLGHYTGEHSNPLHPSDPNYSDSFMRILPFDQAFTFLPTDVDSHSNYNPRQDNPQKRKRSKIGAFGKGCAVQKVKKEKDNDHDGAAAAPEIIEIPDSDEEHQDVSVETNESTTDDGGDSSESDDNISGAALLTGCTSEESDQEDDASDNEREKEDADPFKSQLSNNEFRQPGNEGPLAKISKVDGESALNSRQIDEMQAAILESMTATLKENDSTPSKSASGFNPTLGTYGKKSNKWRLARFKPLFKS